MKEEESWDASEGVKYEPDRRWTREERRLRTEENFATGKVFRTFTAERKREEVGNALRVGEGWGGGEVSIFGGITMGRVGGDKEG